MKRIVAVIALAWTVYVHTEDGRWVYFFGGNYNSQSECTERQKRIEASGRYDAAMCINSGSDDPVWQIYTRDVGAWRKAKWIGVLSAFPTEQMCRESLPRFRSEFPEREVKCEEARPEKSNPLLR